MIQTTMSEGDSLRGLITERLTAAAEDIFLLFKSAIVEYQEELERQQKQLDIFLNPEVYLHRINVPQELVREEEEVLSDLVKNSSPDQEEAEPPRIKEEPEEPCSIQEGEQLELKEETDSFMLTPAHEEKKHSEPELHEHQLLSDSTHVAEDQDPAGSKDKDSESSRNSEPNIPDKIHQSSHNTDVSENQCNPLQDQPSFKCDVCGESFKKNSVLQTHQCVHSGKETHSCKICGKMFKWKCLLKAHMRRHTGERPYSCTACGKGFLHLSILKQHNMIHTGEKPFTCTTCGKSFTQQQNLKVHIRTHTGEKPYSCGTCGKRFSHQNRLRDHNKTHTDDWPSICKMCGDSFRNSTDLKKHVERVHLGKRPHSCSTCGKRFYSKAELTVHMRIHSNEKPYSCCGCGVSFTQKQNLIRHTESKRCLMRATGKSPVV
ncbi:gastrula zinc finger protein XlCGF57.1-like [Cheilinus undulatus]|uniref:gastrula zinc finger protein XlCGF57.1-like n=1 Tax=Cheilinus undulatus TaxID=241271 RepID=UPI001BD2CD09|nr:gastrula zinc finger protein XlCGF57.1-like [Cheilinus undulatus]